MLPSFSSHIIAAVTLAVPADDPGGDLALLPRPWSAAADDQLGRAAAEAQNIRSIATAPWLLLRRRLASCWRSLPSISSETACATPRTPTTSDDPMTVAELTPETAKPTDVLHLEVRNLHALPGSAPAPVKAVDGVSFSHRAGKTTLPSSASPARGKSGDRPVDPADRRRPGRIVSGQDDASRRHGRADGGRRSSGQAQASARQGDPRDPRRRDRDDLPGADVSLSPVHTIGDQIIEMLRPA